MSLARHRTAIETVLMSGLRALRPGFILFGENALEDSANDESWVRMSITTLDITFPCLGNDTKRTDAIFNAQIFTPLAMGANEGSVIVDECVSILKAGTFTGISFLEFDIPTGTKESDWYVLLLRATYRATD